MVDMRVIDATNRELEHDILNAIAEKSGNKT